ncbi:MAG: nucleotidyltransferase domain-containing protein [Chloroflexota bacterium]
MDRKIKKILRELKDGLTAIYGEQLSAVILFGSFARGEGRLPDSDIDVMIVLKGEFDYAEAEKRSSAFIAALCLEYDVLISWVFTSDQKYKESRMPLLLNVRAEGIAV